MIIFTYIMLTIAIVSTIVTATHHFKASSLTLPKKRTPLEKTFYEQVDLPRVVSAETNSPNSTNSRELDRNWSIMQPYAETLTGVKHKSLTTYKEWV